MTDNNFNELLIHTLKQIHIRLDRLDAKVEKKADKADIKPIEQRLNSVENRPDRLESDIRTFKWMLGIGFACLGVLLVLLKPF